MRVLGNSGPGRNSTCKGPEAGTENSSEEASEEECRRESEGEVRGQSVWGFVGSEKSFAFDLDGDGATGQH